MDDADEKAKAKPLDRGLHPAAMTAQLYCTALDAATDLLYRYNR